MRDLCKDCSSSTSNGFIINADYLVAGDGTLTIAQQESITSNQSNIMITAWDIDVAGFLNAGTTAVRSAITMHGSKVAQTLALGSAYKSFRLDDEELGRSTATAGLRSRAPEGRNRPRLFFILSTATAIAKCSGRFRTTRLFTA